MMRAPSSIALETSLLISAIPKATGLYDPAFEHDACGVAMVATLNKIPTHEIVSKGLTALFALLIGQSVAISLGVLGRLTAR